MWPYVEDALWEIGYSFDLLEIAAIAALAILGMVAMTAWLLLNDKT